MALASKDAIGAGGAPFIDPKNHINDVALIIEPRSVRRDVKRPNQKDPRDEVLAQVTVFRSRPQLERGQPHEVKVFTVTPKVVVRDLVGLLDEAKRTGDTSPAVIVKFGTWTPPGTNQKVWVLRTPEDPDYELAAAYYQEREAKTQAAIADAPSFD